MRWSLQWQILFHFSFKISGLEKSLKLSLPLVSRHQSTHDMIRMDVAPPAGFMRELIVINTIRALLRNCLLIVTTTRYLLSI